MAPRSIGPLHPPPPDLDTRDLPIVLFRSTLSRIHRNDKDPAFWGKTRQNRFDAPSGEFGVLYTATDEYGAFIETFGDTIDRTVTTNSLTARGWARVEPARDLQLVDLSGPGLAHIGADERLCSGEHRESQEWSRALWRHPASIDGLYYRARHDPSRTSVALFDRVDPSVTVTRDGGLMDARHQPLLAAILDHYHFSLL